MFVIQYLNKSESAQEFSWHNTWIFCALTFEFFFNSSSIYPPFLPMKINSGGNLFPDADMHNITISIKY